MMKRILNIVALVVLSWVTVQGQEVEEVKAREYTTEHPLVYEDVKDLWPFSFLNDNGQPDGFNVELVRMLLEELEIPYVVRIKSSQEAFEDLRDGKSDLMLGLAIGFHDEYGLYGKNAVTLFTQSVVTPKKNVTVIRNFRDLAKNKVIVNDSSLCHHLMIDYGWGENAIPYTDIEEAIQKVSNDEEGQIVWNDLSLKWLMRKYQIENLQITPVNMPHGEYKFMSNDQALLDKLDSVYSVLDSSEKLTSLRNKWFYPDRKDTGVPSWTWYIAWFLGVLAVAMLVYAIIYRLKAHKLMQGIQGTRHYNVTEQMGRRREREESRLRYQSLFNIPTLGILRFSADGVMVDINGKACEMFGCEREDVLAKRVTFREFLNVDTEGVEAMDGYICTQADCDIRCEVVRNDKGKVQGMFAVCQDTKKRVADMDEKQQLEKEVATAEEEQMQHLAQIDTVLKDGKIRMARYSPDSHTMTILSGTKDVQMVLTQARCMTFVSEQSQRTALRVFSEMDQRMGKELQFDIRTNVSRQKEYPLHLQFSLVPVYGNEGKVTEYFGLCQDITALKAIEDKMVQEMQTVQEIENTKTSFIKNMAQEIRVPVNAIVKYSQELHPQQDTDDCNAMCQSILDNSNYMLHLIDNILYLSRLEAHMIDIAKEPTDFVSAFASCCAAKVMENENVRFITESPYEQLVVDIDAKNVGNIMERVIENAIQHTHQGYIRVRYDYIGWRLMITVEDTGDGMPQEKLEHINGASSESIRLNSGLGLPICKELLGQMDGYIEIDSEEGLGTTVWITIPCKATAIRRKKIV